VLALAVHLIALSLDTYTQFSWAQLLAVPWTSGYRPFAVTLGFLAMVSLLLAAASGALRRRLPGWRTLHAAAYLTFALSVAHGVLAGTDSHSAAALVVYGTALFAVTLTLLRRYLGNQGPSGRPKAQEGVFRKGRPPQHTRDSKGQSNTERAYTGANGDYLGAQIMNQHEGR
jgi:DMSO/TMAO reductase YedYZ heme-binding membrane subunit